MNRDISLKQTTVNRLEELQNELKLESKQRLENEVEMRTSVEATNTKMKMYCDESVEAARQITAVILKKPPLMIIEGFITSNCLFTKSWTIC